MTDEAKALVERLRDYGDYPDYMVHDDRIQAADLIETQAREIERLELQVKYWTARAALGESHDQ